MYGGAPRFFWEIGNTRKEEEGRELNSLVRLKSIIRGTLASR